MLHLDEEIFPDPHTFKADRFYGHGDIEAVRILDFNENPTTVETKGFLEIKDQTASETPIGRKDVRFKKNGIVVKHNLTPFGGGVHLVRKAIFPSG